MMELRPTILFCLCAFLMAGCSSCRAGEAPRAMMAPSAIAQEAGPLNSVHFAFDTAVLTDEAKSVIKENVRWLKANGNLHVELAGHSDSRGTSAYNKSLGLKRAQSTLDYLKTLGMDRGEFTTVSYGDKMPAEPGNNESAYSKSRRVDYNVK